ncbi:acyloxyacyl hydrolase [Spartinivicinus poritis]|uniref:Acyloxyacyl hydrolase n=1 Tax=Spartinivicinus poritis TaxID=2994640 RepID=A0ABT5UEQ2_9GAMM|nr:acyloxyacyl hydrolase [Spartinivicinus sp. A2-2]MDE1464868.1 acyloxyacyl hydrolase [Spartinivicinus sp. A2-2]
MKTKLCLLALITNSLIAESTIADTASNNPMFGDKKSQVMLHGGMSFRSKGFEKLYFGGISYSQPDTFFRLPARNNLELGVFRGKNSKNDPTNKSFKDDVDLSQYDLNMFGISKDVALLSGTNAYLTLGLGAYIKDNDTNRIGSKFTFGERLAVGYRFNNGVVLELYARHFSNGSLTKENSGQNFAGLSAGYTF